MIYKGVLTGLKELDYQLKMCGDLILLKPKNYFL